MKRVAIWLCIVATTVAVVLIALPWFMSRGIVKERIAAQLSSLTGKQVQLNGEGSVSLWPFLRVTYHNVVIGGELAPADLPPLVQMDDLEAQLSFTSAFWGDPQLSQVTLVRPRFSFHVNSQSTDNWTIRQGPLAEQLRLARGAKPEPLSIGTVQIVDGIANYLDARTEVAAQFTDLNGTLSWPDIANSGTATISAVWRGEVIKLIADADSPFKLLRGEKSELTMSFVSKPVNFSYSGEMTIGDSVGANGKMTAICPSPRRLLEWTGQSIPAAAVIAGTFVEGNVVATKNTIEFQDATVRLGEHEGVGRLQLQKGKKNPFVSGTLAFESLWLPNPATLALQNSDVTPTGKLDLSFLEGFELDLRLSARTARLEPFDISNVAAAAIIREGNASFEIGEAGALGGSMAGSISFSKGKGVGFFATDLSLSAVDLEQLTTLFGTGELALQGTGDAQFRLRSTGTSAQGLLINLGGEGVIDGKNGSIRGVNLADLPLDTAELADNAVSPFSGSTPYETLAIKFSIANGSAFLDGSSMENAAQSVSLGGQVNMVRRSLALRGEITRAKQAGGASSSFFVGGNTTSPLFAILPKSGPRPKPAKQD